LDSLLPFLFKNNITMTSNTSYARTLLSTLAISLLMAATGCNRETSDNAASTETPAPTTAEPAAVEPAAAPEPAATASTDPSFAGTYTAGETMVDLTAHGTFAITLDGRSYKGTWAMETDGHTLLLDAESESEPDHRLEILSADSMKLDGDLTLQRKPAEAGEPQRANSGR
jgi:hypothetical protein